MENSDEAFNVQDSQDVQQAANALLNSRAHPSSEFSQPSSTPFPNFHSSQPVGSLGNGFYRNPLYPGYAFGMGASLPPPRSYQFVHSGFHTQGFGIPAAPVPTAGINIGQSSMAAGNPNAVHSLPTGNPNTSNSIPTGNPSTARGDNETSQPGRVRVGGGARRVRADHVTTTRRSKKKSGNGSGRRSRSGVSPVSAAAADAHGGGDEFPSSTVPESRDDPPGPVENPRENESSLSESEDDAVSARARWEDWEVRLLIEAKKLEFALLDESGTRDVIVNTSQKWKKIAEQLRAQGVQCTGGRCKNKWSGLLRDYKKISDHQGKSGNASYASMTAEQRKNESLPNSFEQEWIDTLDTFMQDRPCQNPPGIADSSAVETPADESEAPSAREGQHKMSGKRRRPVGENTRFLVTGITEGMKESMESLAAVMRECEDKQTVVMSQNCDKICDVLKFFATAVVGMGSRAE